MADGALLNRLPFLPDVFSVLIVMVTRVAVIDITLGMFDVGKINRSLAIGPVNLVFDVNLIWNFLPLGGSDR